jgi:membrane-bound lytic murein transglycosylase D
MARLYFSLILLLILAGCSTSVIKEEGGPADVSVEITTYTELDSLYIIVDSLTVTQEFLLDKIDSLENELSYFSSIPLVDKDFQIPRKYKFAGYDIDLSNARVFEKFERIFKAELRAAQRYIPLTGEYFPYFEKVLKDYGIPEDLKYLAVAESYLNPNATSFAKAAGIWQFMPKTGKEYGLKQTDYIDERRDVFKSTDAAARLLRDNHKELLKEGLDDWLLAMCAYNAGMGNVRKDVREQGAKSFFNMIMRVEETDYYVYRAIAIKMIVQYQKEIFGTKFELRKPLEEMYKQVSLTTKGYHEIKEWSKAQGTTIAEVYEINPWIKISKHKRSKYSPLNKVILPPGSFNVLVPISSIPNEIMLAQVNDKLMKKAASPLDQYIVKKGDSLGKIAKRNRMTVGDIRKLNNLKNDNIIPGQKLILNKSYSNGNSENGNENVSSTPKNSAVPDSTKTAVSENTPSGGSDYHIVKKGEYLAKIAAQYNISVEELRAVNNLNSDDIRPDQKLIIKAGVFTYKVKKGDNLNKIAEKFGTTAQKIMADNNLNTDGLAVGQKLDILR